MELDGETTPEVMIIRENETDLSSSSSEFSDSGSEENDSDNQSVNNNNGLKVFQSQIQNKYYDDDRGDGDTESTELTQPQPYKINTDQYSTFCNFCTKRLSSERDLIKHLDDCMPSLKKITDIRKRQCLICYRRIPSFTVCGLIKESISCLIQQWEMYLKTSKAPRTLTDAPTAEMDNTHMDEKDDEVCIIEETSNHTDTEGISELNPLPPKAISDRQSVSEAELRATYPLELIQKPFSQKQRVILIKYFRKKSFPSFEEKVELAEKTELTVEQVSKWFEKMRQTSRLRLQYCQSYFKLRPNSQTDTNPKSRWKRRKHYSTRVTKLLLDSYRTRSHPDNDEKCRLVKETGLRIKQINDWFSNRRRTLKRNVGENLQQEDGGNPVYDCSPISPASIHSDVIAEEFHSQPRSLSFSTSNEKILNNYPDAMDAQKLFESKYAAAATARHYPSLKEIFEMVDETGVEVENLYAWFHKKRKALYERRRQRRRRPVRKSTTMTFGSKKFVNSRTKEVNENENDEGLTNEEDEMKPKELSIRQKFVHVKKIDGEMMNYHISKSAKTLSKILTLKTGEWKSILKVESARLEEANKIIQPFKETQLELIKSWGMELIGAMLKSPSDFELLIHKDLRQTMEVISIWHPVLIYSSILEISVADAVKELYRSSLTRGEKALEQNWDIPDLIDSVPEFPLPSQFT